MVVEIRVNSGSSARNWSRRLPNKHAISTKIRPEHKLSLESSTFRRLAEYNCYRYFMTIHKAICLYFLRGNPSLIQTRQRLRQQQGHCIRRREDDQLRNDDIRLISKYIRSNIWKGDQNQFSRNRALGCEELTCWRQSLHERFSTFFSIDSSECVDDIVCSHWRFVCKLNSRFDDICKSRQINMASQMTTKDSTSVV